MYSQSVNYAEVAELVDALDLGSSVIKTCGSESHLQYCPAGGLVT